VWRDKGLFGNRLVERNPVLSDVALAAVHHPTSASFFRADGTSSGDRSKHQINAKSDFCRRGLFDFRCPTICVFKSASATLGITYFGDRLGLGPNILTSDAW
jgi:hypothetical protein